MSIVRVQTVSSTILLIVLMFLGSIVISDECKAQTVLDSTSVFPTSIDVSTEMKTVAITTWLRNVSQSITFVFVYLGDPDTSTLFGIGELKSGTNQNGKWETTIYILMSTTPGDYPVIVQAYDALYNMETFNTGKTVTILGGDTNPPTLVGEATVTPTYLDVTQGAQPDTVLFTLQDDISGVMFVDAIFRNSSGKHVASNTAMLISGDNKNGTWQSIVTIPQKANSLLYLSIDAMDMAYNTDEIITSKTITITGNDTIQPFYVSPAVIMPSVINISSGDKDVTVDVNVRDDKTGVLDVDCNFLDTASNNIAYGTANLISGDSMDGQWHAIVSVPHETQAGIMTLSIYSRDKAGNNSDTITTSTLQVLKEPESIVTFQLDLRRLYRQGLLSKSYSYSPSVEIFAGVNAGIYYLEDPDEDTIWSVSQALNIDQTISYAFLLQYSSDNIYELNGVSGGRSLAIPSADPIILTPVTFDNLPMENIDTDWAVGISQGFSDGNPYVHEFYFDTMKTFVAIDYLTLSQTSITGVARFAKSPGGSLPSGIVTMASSIYWSINTIPASANFTAKVIFEYNLFGGITDPSSLRLLRRDTHIDPWVTVPTEINIDNGTISALVENDFSEWTFGSVSSENTFIPESPGIAGNPFPANSATEININTEISWSTVGTARTYDIFFWKATDTEPSIPTASNITTPRYKNYSLEYGTTYNWYVVARNIAGSSTSPTWSFTTLNVADLIVSQIDLPPAAYSGKSMDIKWVVTNTGLSGTNPSQWYDIIYLSLDSTFNRREDERLENIQNMNHLNPGESYTNTASVQLPNGIFGQYHIIIITDVSDQVPESIDTNNTFIKPFTVTLTPPPDLQVSSLIVPDNAFSGQAIDVTFKVKNYGLNSTDVSRWYDAVYLSEDTVLNTEIDSRLAIITRDSILLSDSSYSETISAVLPNGISGTYYLFVYSDYSNRVYEYTLEDNNTRFGAINIILTPPPDLIPISVSVPTTGNSGTQISVQWSVQNQGLSNAEGSWQDRIFISRIYPFVLDSSIAINSFWHSGGLEIDSVYTQNENVTLPQGISGQYHVYIEADWDKRIFEHTFDDNNISTADAPITVSLSPWPDLIVTSVQNPDSATASDILSINWTVLNQGAGNIIGLQCMDSIYISTGDVWNRNTAIPIGSLAQTVDIASSVSVSKTLQVMLPSYISTNIYYIYVKTDALNTIYEHTDESNNITRSNSFLIKSFPQADLKITSLTGGDSAFSGKPYSISYQVQNIGGGKTLAPFWDDLIYLSSDTILNRDADIYVTRIERLEPLAAGASYDRNMQITIPNGMSGEYYLFIYCDGTNIVSDPDRQNNIRHITTPLKIILLASPDLRVTSFTTPASWPAGQPISIYWSVQNAGASIDPAIKWYDAIYLSQSSELGNYPVQLGYTEHIGPLGAGNTYSDTLNIQLPLSLSGSYYIIIQTDSRKDIYEHGAENNNLQLTPITITLPPPADLIVTDITIPPTGIAGDEFTISWKIKNQGANQASGYMSESVYLSSDTVWHFDDPLVGVVLQEIDLAPGSSSIMSITADLTHLSYSDSIGEITGPVPGILIGDYHVIVRTNIKHNIRESDFTNNSKSSDDKINIDVPLLPINVLVSDTLRADQQNYFRVLVPPNYDLRLTAATGGATPMFDIYVSFGEVPAPSSYDYKSEERIEMNKEVFVPSTQNGTYYILLRSNSSTIVQEYTIIAETLAFSMTSISPSKGGRGGFVTSILQGAGFRDSTQFFLRKSGENVTEGKVRKINSTMEMVVRWDLTNVSLGTYDLLAENPGGATTLLTDAFVVEPAREFTVSVGKTMPKLLLYGRKEPFSFLFTNTSNVDIPYFFAVLAVPPQTEVELTTSGRLIKRSDQVPDSLIESGKKIEDYTETETGRFLPLIVRDLAPGEAVDCRLKVRNLSYISGSSLPMYLGTRALDRSVFLNIQLLTIEDFRTKVLQNPSSVPAELLVKAYDSKDFARYMLEGYLQLGLIDREDTADIIGSFESDLKGLQIPTHENLAYLNAGKANNDQISSVTGACEDFFFVLGCAAAVGDCFIELPIPTGVSQALCVVGVAGCFGIDTGLLGCAGILSALVCIGKELFCNDIVASMDPNDMIGPEGYGDRHWVALSQRLPYRIRFENDSAKARAPAQRVTINQQFDSSVDIRAFRLGSIGFANHNFEIPGQPSFYSSRLDLRDSLGIYVDITAGIDVSTRKAFWNFKSIDPITGELPSDPMTGLLPINDSLGRGQGFVNYTITPSPSSVTGDSINATARVIFDVNDPLDTKPIFNIIDAYSPQSTVSPLAPITSIASFPVYWSGTDDSAGSGLKNYSIYVSRNDSPYTAWLTDVTDTSAIFYGANGSQYKFISLAKDNAGNVEKTKLSHDAVTQIITGIDDDKDEIPAEYALKQNYPNPFNPTTIIRYDLPEESFVTLKVYNVLGQEVATLVNEKQTAGKYNIEFSTNNRNGVRMASGVYFYRLQTEQYVNTKKLILLR